MIQSSTLTPEYVWNERAGRYASVVTGRFVSARNVKAALEGVVKASGDNITALSQSLLDGNITLAEWRAQMMVQVKTAHTAAAAAARGGWAQMSQSDWGAVGQLIKRQYQYLENFAQEIASGKQKLDGRLLTRAKMYAEAPRGTFEQIARRMAANKGMTEERRVLGFAEHCIGCTEQAALGWQPIGTLAPIGSQECRSHCQCHYEFR